MKNYLLVNRALAAEKNINYFNNLFSRVKEHSSPTVNRRSTDGQSQRQYTFGVWKYVAMMALLLTLACGQAWADKAASSTLDISTVTSSNWGTWTPHNPQMDANGFHVSSPMVYNSTSPTWFGHAGLNTGSVSWNATTHCLSSTTFKGSSGNINTAKLKTTQKAYFRITGCSTVYASVKAVSGNSISLKAYEYNGSRAGSASFTSTTSTTSLEELSLASLDASKTYEIELIGNGTSDGAYFYAICFVPAASSRTFKSGEKVFFKDASGNITWGDLNALWKVSTGNIYAYFWNDTESAWSSAATAVGGSVNAASTVYSITVPGSGKEFTKVLFTRGTAATFGSGFWNETTDQYPAEGKNMFCISNDGDYDGSRNPTHKWIGTWDTYSNGPAIVGSMNNWRPDGGEFDFSGSIGTVYIELEAETNYTFKVLEGTTWYGNAGTISNSIPSDWWGFVDKGDECTITTAEAGTYAFKWNNDNKKLGVWYPRGRLAKNKYLYFDGRNESNWDDAAYHAKYLFKRYDSDDQVGDLLYSETPLEDWVYYQTTPNNDYVGQVQIMRMDPSNHATQWNYANIIAAHSRTSELQNCLVAPSSGWSDITLTWGTYCPPMTTPTLSDNGTTTYGGSGTEGSPYLVEVGKSINVQATGSSSSVPDPDMTAMYDFKVGGSTEQNTTSKTFTYTASTTHNTTHTLTVDAYNTYNETNSTKNTSSALYYKAVTIYDIAYKKGANGTGTEYTDTKIKGTNITLRGAIFTRTGYTQTGWATSDGGAKAHNLSATYSTDADATLYPFWTADSYTITYKDQGGADYTGSNSASLPATHTYGSATDLVNGVRSGYQFLGWYTDESCSVSAGSSIGATAKTADFTLYAKWVQLYTITPAAKYTNDGDDYTSGTTGGTLTINSESSAQSVASGSSYTITATPASGYCLESLTVGETSLFAQASGNSRQTAAYSPSSQTASGNVTVTAKFAKLKTISVYVYTGDKIGWVPQNIYCYVGQTSIGDSASVEFTDTHSKWKYYTIHNVTKLQSSIAYSGAAHIQSTTITGTIYYDWDKTVLSGLEDKASVTYSDQAYVIGADAITLSPTYANFGSSLTYAWSVTSKPDGGDYTFSSITAASPTFSATVAGTYTVKVVCTDGDGCSKNCSFNVVVTASSFTVTYKANDGSGDDVVDDSSETIINVPNSFTAPSGKTFMNWNVAGDGSGAVYNPGDEISSDLTLYAQWGYVLTYDANAGGDAVSNMPANEVHKPSAITLSSTVPTRSGYTFDCWNRNAAGTGDCFDAGASFTTGAENQTLYAKWTENACPSSGTLFALTMLSKVTGKNDYELSKSTEVNLGTASYATITGGSAIFRNNDPDNDKKAVITKDSPNRLKFAGNKAYLKLDLDCSLQTGDSIILTWVSGPEIAFTLNTASGTDSADSTTIIDGKHCFIVPAGMDGESTIYCWRSRGNSSYITGIKITRPAAAGYTISLDDQTPTIAGNVEEISVTLDESTNLTGTVVSQIPIKVGHTFGGYYTATGGSGTQIIAADGTVNASASDASYTYTDGDKKWGYEGNITLYAKWTKRDHIYWLSGNGATVGTNGDPEFTETATSGIYTYKRTITTNETFHIGDGLHPFWHENDETEVTTSSSNVTLYYSGATYWFKYTGGNQPVLFTLNTNNSTLTLSDPTYTITLDGNGGTGNESSVTATYNSSTIAAITNPTMANYTFDGWYKSAAGAGGLIINTSDALQASTDYTDGSGNWTNNGDVTVHAAWKQTVTLKTGAQGSGADKTPYVYINGTGVNSFTAHTASGYTLQGYYTAGSGGVKVLNADGTFAAANVTDYITSSKWSRTGAAPTLYAQWVASEDCRTLKYAWKITGNFCDDESTSVTASDTVRFPANASNLYFTVSGTGNTVSTGSSYNIGKTQNNYFLLTAKTGYQIKSICFYGKVEDSSVNYTTDGSTWSTLESKGTGSDKYYTFDDIDASAFGIKLTASSPKGVWIRNMVIEVCAEGGATYNVTYAGNDETGGSAPSDATNYSYGGTVTVLGNTGSLEKTNYTFAGWTTNNNGTGSSYEAGSTFSITDNTTLYAKWTQAVTFDANTENHGSTGGSATAVWNATGLTGITHATPASGYKLLGYYTAATSGTKVLNSDGSFAETDVTDYITDGKWSRTSTTTLYAQYEVAGSLTWNLVINSDTTSLTTSSKTSSFTEILNSNMTNAALVGLDYLSSDRKKKSLTGKISTPTSFDEDKYVSVSFVVADGYKFTPSSAKVIIQPVSTSSSDVKIILSDGTRTITQTKDNLAKGNKDTVTLTNSDATKYMVGTVTMKIYVYGAEDTYRLGTPITIEGEVEEACATMPDYTSMSYTTLDYTIGDTPGAISIVGGENIDTYTWMQNTTNDRTSGSAVSTGTGYDTYSFTPSIASAGTTYYWCEMTNTSCGLTIKSSAVAVTVSASKTNPTVTWDPKAKLNDSDTTAYYGGKDYTIKATLNSGWNGTLTADMMTAPAGIRLHDFTIDNSSNPKTIQATFDVQTGFNVDENDSIAFTLSLPETATYNALNSQKKVAYNVCSGGGSADEYLMPVDAAHIDNDTWKGAWVYEGTGMMCYGHGSSSISAGTKDANIKTLAHTMADGAVTKYYKSSASHFGFYTEKAITGVRMYVYTSNTKSTVSGVYISNSASSSSTPSTGAISYEAEYYNDDDGLLAATNDGCTWVEITFANEVPAGKYGQINVSSNVYIAGIALISGSGAGASKTTTLGFASASVSKTQSDANFTYLATTSGENANTLGAITYSSSNTSCATVNATTGEVDITATGSSEQSTTITATLAASGCFKGATAMYTLTVAGQSCDINAGTLAITAGEATKCASDNVTLSLSGHTTAGTTVTWYRGETDVTASVKENKLTTSDEGTYSVVVSDGGSCTVRSNAVTISYKSAEASVSKLVDEWYIKQGRLTPDVALFDVADATSWTVKKGKAATAIYTSDGETTTTGLAGAAFKQVDDIVYLAGTAPTGIASAANDTIFITVTDACGNNATSDSIVIHKQIATDKHVLAFVVTGTEKGGFTAGLAAEQTTELQLYKTLTKNFDVVATNIYSTDDEQKLKEYYSQFDILCITDYPNTKTKGVNSKSYVDAIGSLIDIRPILTMEAWVSGLTNWKSKGISGTPHSPSTRQYSMLLQCKDHEIFAGTSLTKIGEGDETMYRVTMVDQTIEEYPTLDGYTPGSKAYDAGGKPALQGFEYTSAMSDLLPIGRIDDGAGNNLQVGIERQHEMEARLLVLGINSYAMERLTVDGEKVVVNALKYLMKKDAEDISDCSVYFDDASGDHMWNNPENWGPSYKTLPLSTQEVRIYKPCIVDTVVRAASVKIIPDGKYSHGAATANGKLTIAPTGALIVDGKIYAATAPNFYEKRTTVPENLVVEANSTKTGTLIFDNEDGETQATIEMYSPSHWEIDPGTGKYVKYWSYVGMPIKDVHIPDYFYGAFTYYFNEAKGWEKRFDNDIMQPFEGIGLSMQAGNKETFFGTMVSTENIDIPITYHKGAGDGDNLIGNSWTAPIQIANFDEDDFGSCWATVYIFNTGKGGNTYVNATTANDGAAKAGQWLGVPIGIAGLPDYTGLKVIPAMNAFLVHDTLTTATTLHLDYDKLVREDIDTLVKYDQINEKMRAPRKKKDVEGLLRIRVVGEKTNTDVWMLQDPRFSEGFDNGWEAYYNPCDDRSAQLYARSAIGAMCFLALPDLDGTTLGFAPSRDGNDYTFTFQYRGEDEYYLNDLKLQQSVLIDADNSYAFTYEKGDTNRFYISRTPLQAPQNPTDVENTSDTPSPKAIKVIYNDKLYIINGGRVYSADGMLVK